MESSEEVYGLILKKLKEEGFDGPVTLTAVVGYLDSFVPKLHDNITIKYAHEIPRPTEEVTRENQAADGCLNNIVGKWLKKERLPQNGFIISGDAGFGKTFKSLKSKGHSTFGVVAKGKDEDTPTYISDEVKLYWVWRPFLGMSAHDGTSSRKRKIERNIVKGKIEMNKKKKLKKKKQEKLQRRKERRLAAQAEGANLA